MKKFSPKDFEESLRNKTSNNSKKRLRRWICWFFIRRLHNKKRSGRVERVMVGWSRRLLAPRSSKNAVFYLENMWFLFYFFDVAFFFPLWSTHLHALKHVRALYMFACRSNKSVSVVSATQPDPFIFLGKSVQRHDFFCGFCHKGNWLALHMCFVSGFFVNIVSRKIIFI